jgi:hypothetical protein
MNCSLSSLRRSAVIAVFSLVSIGSVAENTRELQPSAVVDNATIALFFEAPISDQIARDDKSSSQNPALQRATRYGAIDTSALFASAPGSRVEFAISGHTAVSYRTERILVARNGGRTWVGVLNEIDAAVNDVANNIASGPRAYVSEYDGAVVAQIDTGVAQFEVLPYAAELNAGDAISRNALNKRTNATLIDLAAINATRAVSAEPDYVLPLPLSERPQAMRDEADALRKRVNDAQRNDLKAAPSPQSTIDVMVAYTPEMVTRYTNTAGVIARINQLIAYANTAYSNSEVAITLSLVHTVQVAYVNSGATDSARLNELTNGTGAGLGGIAALRNTYGADLVVLLRSFESTHGGCGIGWIGGYQVSNIGDDSPIGYSLVNDGTYPDGQLTYYCALNAFAHELGHNMGLMHNRGIVAAGQLGATAYAFGHLFTGSNGTVGDVMAYADNDAHAFSKPNIFCNGTGSSCAINGSGTVLGVTAGSAVEACASSAAGCDAANAGACTSNSTTCADASRALNFTRVKVSQFRASVGCPPALAGGGTCKLDIDGNGKYEASKDGVLIVRRMLGFSGPTLIAGASDTCATRTDAAALATFIDNQALDVDTSGGTKPENALTDGLLILRAMLGLTGTAVTNGLTTRAWDTGTNPIKSYLNNTCSMGLP